MVWAATAIAGVSLLSGLKQGSDARKAAGRSSDQERLATEERIRQLGLESDRLIGTQRANAAASGVSVESKSVLTVQTETIDEIEREKKFVRQAGAFAAESAKLQGRAASYQGYSNALNSAGQIFSLISKNRQSKQQGGP